MDEKTQEIVRQSSLFKDISPLAFERVLETSLLRSVEEDGFYFMQTDPATHAYVLVEGRVRMIQITPTGQQITLRILTPGQTYGGIALINPGEGYPATAQAMENSSALAWDTTHLRKLAEMEPSIPLNAMQLMLAYITELQERQKALITDRVEQRIARILLKLAAQYGKKVEEGVLINFALTRQDIAEMSGTTLFTVSRTLKEWERQGMVKIGREKVCICEPHGLVSLADDLVQR